MEWTHRRRFRLRLPVAGDLAIGAAAAAAAHTTASFVADQVVAFVQTE